jgi:uncharacterized protein YcbK (DUF882 family)
MEHFTMKELTVTATGLPNEPDEEQTKNLMHLVLEILDPLRTIYGAPIKVNSGFRSPEVNRRVGGVPNSQHLRGEAVDITAGCPIENRKLFQMIATAGFQFDQLIDEEKYRWIHVSLKRTGSNRRQILHL